VLKTVAEIADKCGVSRVAIYKRINDTMKEELKPFVVKKENVTHLLPEGVELIEQSFANKQDIKGENESTDSDTSVSSDSKEILERLNRLESEYIDTLKQELKRKNEQLEKKDELLQNFQVIVRQNQERIAELEGEVQKQSWWEKLKWW